jgi:BCD family chlorophyll transporter-like MFS transporter
VPFAEAAGGDLPLGRLARLSLFQISVGMALVLLNGTLNRVMVLEMGQAAWLVSLMVSLPLLFAPLRAMIGFRSDHHKSLLGWRRVPYIWGGSMAQFGGLAIMPFALIVLADPTAGPAWLGPAAAALAFLLVGAGLHTRRPPGLPWPRTWPRRTRARRSSPCSTSCCSWAPSAARCCFPGSWRLF